MSDAHGERRIVVGVDGSPQSLAALRWAAGEAHLRGSVIDAVYAWTYSLDGVAPYAALRHHAPREQQARAADEHVAAAVFAVLGSSPDVDVRPHAQYGRAVHVLLEAAAGAELLVLGLHRPDEHSGESLGPVARVCVVKAGCPVVTVGASPPIVAAPPYPSGHRQSMPPGWRNHEMENAAASRRRVMDRHAHATGRSSR